MWFLLFQGFMFSIRGNRSAPPTERLDDALGEIGTFSPDLLAIHLDAVDAFALVGRIDARAAHEHDALARLRQIRRGTGFAPICTAVLLGIPLNTFASTRDTSQLEKVVF